MIKCINCNEEKSEYDFNKCHKNGSQFFHICKVCGKHRKGYYNSIYKEEVYEINWKRIFNYGFTEDEIEKFLSDKKECRICGNTKSLCIDHCHKTNKYRGILCSGCNFGIGHLRDNKSFLRKAIYYLTLH